MGDDDDDDDVAVVVMVEGLRYLDAVSVQSAAAGGANEEEEEARGVDLVNLLPGSLGVTEVSLVWEPRLSRWLMTTLPPFENKVRGGGASQPLSCVRHHPGEPGL